MILKLGRIIKGVQSGASEEERLKKKALIAMSGGVDSSVAAYLMKERGYECIGVTMKLFQNTDVGISKDSACCSLEDAEDARRVAFSLGMRHYVWDFSDKFSREVLDRFVNAYEHGRTPNPCIDCNRYLKFEMLFRRAMELGYDTVVTGHYVRTAYDALSGRYLLKKAADPSKDQSYVLYSLTQEQLAHVQFPLGEMEKHTVREIAKTQGFVNAKKPDSQDICFVPEGSYVDFIRQYTGKTYPHGNFIDKNGELLGKHQGVIRYTVGQRKGLGLAFGEPMYVTAVDAVRNTVTLGTNEDLFTSTLTAKDVNLVATDHIEGTMRVKAKVRYRQKEQWADVRQLSGNLLQVTFTEPQRAITAGQAVVLYDGDVVIGGGTIQ